MSVVPYALTNPEHVLAMPDREQVPLLWEALQFVLAEVGQGRHPEELIQRNLDGLHVELGRISYRIKHELREEGAWRDLTDPRWPSNYAGEDERHLYKSGAMPPALMVWEPTDDSYTELDRPTRLRLQKELAAWGATPAGRANVAPETLERLNAAIQRAQEATDQVRIAKLDWDMARLCDDLSAPDPDRWNA